MEAALAGCDGVAQAVVTLDGAHVEDGGSAGPAERLVGYVVGVSGLDVAAITSAVARRLPSHMVPSQIVVLDAMPLTVSGKI
ncbi:AMP-binding enzyme, partial [Nocardia sp. R7R-8]|uniref:AMP-binding enzyme n=1 Tax=Nocardia sp. R7R-8 TaxID=3459304 RepID=UPI00403D9BB9